MFTHHTAFIQKGSKPVLICASGPSLKSNLEKIKEHRNDFFLLAVSSSLLVLVKNNIIPDAVLSTDGGYWAKLHLHRSLLKYNIPLVLTAEGSCFAKFLLGSTIIPINYGDGPAADFLKEFGYECMRGLRNGTVSGTAADFALNITTSTVYFCGLDLAPTKGFNHTQPNELENSDSINDFRLCTQETRNTPKGFSSPALKIYLNWFKSQDFKNRLYRLSSNFKFSNKIESVPDVNWDFFEERIKEKSTDVNENIMPQIIKKEMKFDLTERKEKIVSLISKNLNNPEWIKNALPSEMIILERSIGTEKEKDAYLAMNSGMKKFFSKILRALGKYNDLQRIYKK